MRIASLGAGRMGRGIGHVFAYAGYEVDIIDFKPGKRDLREAGDRRRSPATSLLAGLGLRERAQQAAILKRIRVVAIRRRARGARGADVAVRGRDRNAGGEARRLRARLPAPAARRDHRVDHLLDAGGHAGGDGDAPGPLHERAFSQPGLPDSAGRSEPGEIHRREHVRERSKALLESAGKVVVRCAPSPGFIVPRLQAAAMNEAARLVEEGVATPEDIDRAVRAGFGPRYTAMGLCEFIDYGGLDILYYASSSMAQARSTRRATSRRRWCSKLMEAGQARRARGRGTLRLARARPAGLPEGAARALRRALPPPRPAAAAALDSGDELPDPRSRAAGRAHPRSSGSIARRC